MGELNAWLLWGGVFVGIVFGLIMQRFHFCMVTATRNMMLNRDYHQASAFAAAWLVGIAGTQLLELMDVVDISTTGYRNSTLDWLGALLGGVIFGVGAALAGGCSIRTITRSMEGNLQALLALLMFAIVGGVTQFGFLEPVRLKLTEMSAAHLQTDAGLASMLSMPAWLVAAIIVIALIGFIAYCWRRGSKPSLLVAGIIVGGLVVASWYITGVLAQDEFDPVRPSAMTISGPMARFGYILISGSIPTLSFTIMFTVSAAAAIFLSAIVTGKFRITPIEKGMLIPTLVGGSLMGIGGVIGYGCNIGQGLSGISTLSVESMLAVAGMFIGATICSKCWKGGCQA